MDKPLFKFEELRVYQDSLSLINSVYTVTTQFPKEELFGLTNQLQRAVTSIALNIAEGSSRGKKDFRRFLDIARGSCYECVAILTIAKNRTYITTPSFNNCYEQFNKLARMINALRKSLQ